MTYVHNFLFKLKLSFHFYRKLLISSVFLSLFLIFLGNIIEVILLVKLFLIGLIFLNKRFFESKDSLLYYKNFGISPLFLFTYCVLTDFFLSIFLYKLTMLI